MGNLDVVLSKVRHEKVSMPMDKGFIDSLYYNHLPPSKIVNLHTLRALHPDHGDVGSIEWDPNSKQVENIYVEPDHRNKGVASRLWQRAHDYEPGIKHSFEMTPDGRDWATSLGEDDAKHVEQVDEISKSAHLVCPQCQELDCMEHDGRINSKLAEVTRTCVRCKEVFDESQSGEHTGFCQQCREEEGMVTHHSWSEDLQEGHYGATGGTPYTTCKTCGGGGCKTCKSSGLMDAYTSSQQCFKRGDDGYVCTSRITEDQAEDGQRRTTCHFCGNVELTGPMYNEYGERCALCKSSDETYDGKGGVKCNNCTWQGTSRKGIVHKEAQKSLKNPYMGLEKATYGECMTCEGKGCSGCQGSGMILYKPVPCEHYEGDPWEACSATPTKFRPRQGVSNDSWGWLCERHHPTYKISARKPRAWMGVGIPGSGKSTHLKPWAESIGATYVSSDETRKEVTGDEADVTQDARVWPEVYRKVHEGLSRGDVVVDATHSNGEKRRHMVKHILEKADGVTALYFDVPLDLAKERNRGREREVPEGIIEGMHSQLEEDPPWHGEGFDQVIKMHSPRPGTARGSTRLHDPHGVMELPGRGKV